MTGSWRPSIATTHELSGDHAGVRECHIGSEWLLIYDKEGSVATGALRLIRTGSHSELFYFTPYR